MNESECLRAVAEGDQNAFSILYRSLRRKMLGYALGILAGDLPAAEDAVDEAFLDIWQKAGQFSGHGSATAWIRRIVRNKAIDWLRKNADEKVDIDHYSGNQTENDSSLPNTLIATISDRDWLKKALLNLSPSQRETMLLFYYEEMQISEIAVVMGCPENTVKTRLHHSRQKMRTRDFELEF